MKKMAFALVLFLVAVDRVHAAGEVWKASHTETADARVLISSEGILSFGGVHVGSASPNSYIYIYDARQWGAAMDTVTAVDCSLLTYDNFKPVKISSGLFYTKVGDAKVDIFWNVILRNPNVLPQRTR